MDAAGRLQRGDRTVSLMTQVELKGTEYRIGIVEGGDFQVTIQPDAELAGQLERRRLRVRAALDELTVSVDPAVAAASTERMDALKLIHISRQDEVARLKAELSATVAALEAVPEASVQLISREKLLRDAVTVVL